MGVHSNEGGSAGDPPAPQIFKLDANRQPRFDKPPEGLVLIEAAQKMIEIVVRA